MPNGLVLIENFIDDNYAKEILDYFQNDEQGLNILTMFTPSPIK